MVTDVYEFTILHLVRNTTVLFMTEPTKSGLFLKNIRLTSHMENKKQFEYGCYQTTYTQQQIAFWTHVIDTFASVLEHTENIYTNGILQSALDASGTTESYAYMGAVRYGFNKALMHLPDDVKEPVEIYWKERMARCKSVVPEDVLDIDFILGTGDPFR